MRRSGFRAVATLGDERRAAGFGYGYVSGARPVVARPGRSARCGEDQRKRWLTDCFEVVELHVRPDAQGHGLGARQLRALLGMAPGATTLLSTPEADEQRSRAWRLYRRFDFADVLRDFRFPGDDGPSPCSAGDLPLRAPSGE